MGLLRPFPLRNTHFHSGGDSVRVPVSQVFLVYVPILSARISDFSGENPGLGHFGQKGPKVATRYPARAAHHHLAQTRPSVTLEGAGPYSLPAIFSSF